VAFARDAAAFGGRDAAVAALARDAGDLEARFALASAHAAALEWEPALAELLELVKRNRKFRDDAARRAMLAIFDHLGPQHPAVSDYRRQLQIIL
jgi:putative thioredoxin